MPKLLPRHYGKILYYCTRDLSGAELTAAVKNFISFVARRHNIKQIKVITNVFIDYARQQEGIMDITVVSARPLSARLLDEITGQFGKGALAACEIDKELLGGVLVKTRAKILDGSVKAQLAAMKASLK